MKELKPVIHDEKNGLDYILVGDYYIPLIQVPEETRDIGFYGSLRKNYLKDYKKETILAPLFKFLEVCFELMVPLVMAQIIDVGIVNKDGNYVIKMCLLMVLLGVIGLAAAVTAQYFSARAAVGVSQKLRKTLFSHIQSLSFSEIEVPRTSISEKERLWI